MVAGGEDETHDSILDDILDMCAGPPPDRIETQTSAQFAQRAIPMRWPVPSGIPHAGHHGPPRSPPKLPWRGHSATTRGRTGPLGRPRPRRPSPALPPLRPVSSPLGAGWKGATGRPAGGRRVPRGGATPRAPRGGRPAPGGGAIPPRGACPRGLTGPIRAHTGAATTTVAPPVMGPRKDGGYVGGGSGRVSGT